jgi:response regulator of citrate/malate metabolism
MYKVMIVEDDPMVASINQQYLERNQNLKIVGQFRNGQEALEYLENNGADLAVVDYYMPIMDGLEFVRKCHEKNIKTDVIIVTAANTAQDISEFLQLGIVDYLVKPFTYERFQKAIDKYLYRKNLAKQDRTLDQAEIDKLLSQDQNIRPAEKVVLEKGLQEQTLERIRTYLEEHKGTLMSSNEIASEVNLSRITVRRYMNYLVENREIISQIDYSTGGRPSIKYTKN